MALESGPAFDTEKGPVQPSGSGPNLIDVTGNPSSHGEHSRGPAQQSWSWKMDPQDLRNNDQSLYSYLSPEQRAFVDRVADQFPSGAVYEQEHNEFIKDAIVRILKGDDISDDSLIKFCHDEEQKLESWRNERQSHDRGQVADRLPGCAWKDDPRRQHFYETYSYSLSDEKKTFIDNCIDHFPPSEYSEEERNQIINGTIKYALNTAGRPHLSEQEYCAFVKKAIERQRQTDPSADALDLLSSAADLLHAKLASKALGQIAFGMHTSDALPPLVSGGWVSQYKAAASLLSLDVGLACGPAGAAFGPIASKALDKDERFAWARSAERSFYFDNQKTLTVMQDETQQNIARNSSSVPWIESAFQRLGNETAKNDDPYSSFRRNWNSTALDNFFNRAGASIASAVDRSASPILHDALLPETTPYMDGVNKEYKSLYEAMNPFARSFVDDCVSQFSSSKYSKEEINSVVRAAIDQAMDNNSIYPHHETQREFCNRMTREIAIQRHDEDEVSPETLYRHLTPQQQAFVDRCRQQNSPEPYTAEEQRFILRAAIAQAILNNISSEDEIAFSNQAGKFIQKWRQLHPPGLLPPQDEDLRFE